MDKRLIWDFRQFERRAKGCVVV